MAQIILEDLSIEERTAIIEARAKKQAKLDSIKQYKDGEKFKYKLTVEGYSHVQTIKSDFQITYIYDLIYVGYDEDNCLYRFDLTEVSYTLDKYEDPVLAQVIEMSNQVSAIYLQLDFGVDKYGTLKKLYNVNQIMKRWEKVKEHLTYKHPLSSFEIIKIKEKELKNLPWAMTNISFMHFFQIYFKQFGRFNDREAFQVRHMDQFGSGIPFQLGIEFIAQPDTEEGLMHRKMSGRMIYNAETEKELCKAVKDNSAEVDYTTRADYYSDGMILEEVNFSYNQKIGEGYDMYSYLHLTRIKDE